ncbi:ABC transporter permease [Paenibacillus kobensis]|uniref:ABC transporter permease n=1 Tax=Paenibacillus kobensis TaxID=59841 RepID=UPI000FD83E28|nr:FtsX-like permease family protein [Paenibacillus kobensis]
MSLLQLTVRNVKRNFRLYWIYLFSMIAGVIIQYTFSSLMYNEDVMNALQNRDTFRTGGNIASVVVYLFIVCFILYANSFFMRQRIKEFGMYLLYGLSERQVVRMVFYETLALGAVALLAGVLLGGLLSKLFGMLLMNLMQYDQTISLSFPAPAIAGTAALFLLLAVIISVQSYVMVNRLQLTELFRAKAKAEKPVPVSAWRAIAAVLLIGIAFALIYTSKQSVIWTDYSAAGLIAVTVGIIAGTYLFFRQFAGWVLRAMSRGRKYHEGHTVLWTSALRFQIRGNTLNLTFITLFGAVIMMLMCFMTINYKVQFEAVGRNLPNDIAFESLDKAANERIDGIISSSGHPARFHLTHETLVAHPSSDRGLAFDSPELYSTDMLLVPEHEYNEIVDIRGDDRHVSLQGNEAVALSQGTDFPEAYRSEERREFTVSLLPADSGQETSFTFVLAEKKDYAYLGWASDPVNSMDKKPAVLVVSNEAYERLRPDASKRMFEMYGIENAKTAEELSVQVHGIVKQTSSGAYYSSFADVYSKQIEGSSLMLFSSGFLALLATFALASVIYFKQLREATDGRQQYAVLRKLGIDERQIKSVIRKQLLFVFLPPLALGILYSWSIIKAYILDSVSDFPELPGITWGIIGVYFLVYVMFYMSSVNLYYRIVSQRN